MWPAEEVEEEEAAASVWPVWPAPCRCPAVRFLAGAVAAAAAAAAACSQVATDLQANTAIPPIKSCTSNRRCSRERFPRRTSDSWLSSRPALISTNGSPLTVSPCPAPSNTIHSLYRKKFFENVKWIEEKGTTHASYSISLWIDVVEEREKKEPYASRGVLTFFMAFFFTVQYLSFFSRARREGLNTQNRKSKKKRIYIKRFYIYIYIFASLYGRVKERRTTRRKKWLESQKHFVRFICTFWTVIWKRKEPFIHWTLLTFEAWFRQKRRLQETIMT